MPKLSDSSKNFIQKIQRDQKTILSWIDQKTQSKKRKKALGGKEESKGLVRKRTKLEVEIYWSPGQHQNLAGRGTEGKGNMRLTSEATLVVQDHDFATSIGTID